VEKGSLLPPVRPDCSQQLHSFIFMYWEENVTQLFDTLVSEMLDGAGHEPRPSRPVGWPGLVSGNIGRLNTRHNKHCPCRGTEQRCRVCLSRGVTRRFKSKCVEGDVYIAWTEIVSRTATQIGPFLEHLFVLPSQKQLKPRPKYKYHKVDIHKFFETYLLRYAMRIFTAC